MVASEVLLRHPGDRGMKVPARHRALCLLLGPRPRETSNKPPENQHQERRDEAEEDIPADVCFDGSVESDLDLRVMTGEVERERRPALQTRVRRRTRPQHSEHEP